jgi:D-alanyl-D-alanine carboxypeptidase (penicillin-binding protein 5/6)
MAASRRSSARWSAARSVWSAAVLAVAVVLCLASAAQAQFQSKARQAFLMDAETGSVLYQKSADELMPPASMSKLMTLALIFKELKAGKIRLESQMQVSTNAWRTGGAPSGTAAMFLPINAKPTVGEIIQGIIVQSGNDASITAAENLTGSEANFARKMTEYARMLGMTRSTFANSTGLPHGEHVMTARELGVLARHLILEYPDYYPWFGQKEMKYGRHRFINRNPLLFMSQGFDGLKTGQTADSGFGIVASAVQEGRRLIVVLNGLTSKEERKAEAAKLVDWGFKSFVSVKLFDPGDTVGSARVWGGSRFFVPLVGNGDVTVLMPRFVPRGKFTAAIAYKGPLKPPIKRGDQIASLRVTTQAGTVSEAPLYAAEDIEPSSVWMRGLDTLVYMAFRWVPL